MEQSKEQLKSQQLAKLWPNFFTNTSIEVEVLAKCLTLMEGIEKRYCIDCNPTITRAQIKEIQEIINLINNSQ